MFIVISYTHKCVFIFIFSFQISTNANLQIFVNTMELASIITAHTFVTVQMDGKDNIVKMVSKINLNINKPLFSLKRHSKELTVFKFVLKISTNAKCFICVKTTGLA